MITKKMNKLITEIKRNVELRAEVKDAPTGLAFKRDKTWTKLKISSEVDALVRESLCVAIEVRVSRLIASLEELTIKTAADAAYKKLKTVCPTLFAKK